MAQQRRTAAQYEDELRKHELGLARSLQQAVPGGGMPSPDELGALRRALARAIRELRQLRRELVMDLQAADDHGKGRPAPGRRSSGRNDVIAYEAAANAIDEVLERWERRREQLEGGPGPSSSGGRSSGPGEGPRRRRPDRQAPPGASPASAAV
jgi:hypothetical protein